MMMNENSIKGAFSIGKKNCAVFSFRPMLRFQCLSLHFNDEMEIFADLPPFLRANSHLC